MTQEEKAKRYDEALRKAKNYYSTTDSSSDIKLIGLIFPELAESEDEKIRKSLIDMLKNDEKCYLKEIAWLEKQGEQKLYVNNNAKEMFIKALERVEEQNNKGYKLTDCDKNSWWEDFKTYTSCTVEQKPAWSEEDERKINYLIALLQNSTMNDDALRVMNEEVENWLKSLRPQNRWRPSEAQMTALNYVINLMASSESALENDYYYNVFKDLREQLKNLTE